MLHSPSELRGRTERRAAPRHACNGHAHCRVTEPLEQEQSEAGLWNVSTGGVCVVLEPYYPIGARLTVELRRGEDDTVLIVWADVEHALLCPSFREMWLTGCSFQDSVPEETVRCCG